MPLFHPRVIEKNLANVKPVISSHNDILSKWAENINNGIYDSETQNDGEFIQRILIDILGYVGSSNGIKWSVAKNQPVGKGNVDVALGVFTATETSIIAPLELKGARTRDLDAIMPGRNKSPVKQAWEYAIDAKGVQWVLVSNYREIRLYAFGAGTKDYERFDLTKLNDPYEYARFILILSAENLLGGVTATLLKDSEAEEKEITKNLYAEYKLLRENMIDGIQKLNPTVHPIDIIRHTQTILDRVLFIAFAEDKSLLPGKTIKKAFETVNPFNRQLVWENFKGLFRAVDKGDLGLNIPAYNGGLFKDNESINKLNISDEICAGFNTIGEYRFDIDVSVEILGHIFEQSIGDLEQLKAAVEEEKISSTSETITHKGRRKKDGIFYTPAYITHFIVEQVVGGWLADQRKRIGFDALPELTDEDYNSIKIIGKRKIQFKHNQNIAAHIKAWSEYQDALAGIRVLDPACGSGAFLNEVFDYLYSEGQTINNELARLTAGQTTLFRWDKHILSNNIYGVDINSESVEITKLSLWLKTANRNEKLTYLDDNIKVGNSLISDVTVDNDKAFDWHDGFPNIMSEGGFDVIVGNPPYVFARDSGFTEEEKVYYYANYNLANFQLNTYALFIELGLNRIKDGGYLGYIIPNTWLTISSFSGLRRMILNDTANTSIINIKDSVFADASVDCCILSFSKTEIEPYFTAGELTNNSTTLNIVNKSTIDQNQFIIRLKEEADSSLIVNKMNEISTPLGEVIGLVTTGLKAYQIGKGKPKQDVTIKNTRAFHSYVMRDNTYFKYLEGRDVKRYRNNWSGEYLSYGDWLAEPRRSVSFTQSRILIRQIPSKPPYCIEACLITGNYLNDINSMVIQGEASLLEALLPILNSRLLSWWFVKTFDKFQRKTFPQFKVNELKSFPIRNDPDAFVDLKSKSNDISKKYLEISEIEKNVDDLIAFEHKIVKPFKLSEQTVQDCVSSLAEKILPVQLSLSKKAEWLTHLTSEKAKIELLTSDISVLNTEIDEAVYKLYELTETEIELINMSF